MPETPDVDTSIPALRASVEHLAALVTPLDDATIQSRAYPAEWTIADVLSHIGSGAVIMQRRLDDSLLDVETPDDFPPSVWDTWNAKSPRAMADDALVADRVFLDRLEALDDDERTRVQLSMGPMSFDLVGMIGLSLNEHVVHTWDVDVALDPAAVLQPETVPFLVDNLDLIARFTGKASGGTRTVHVETTDPVRNFTIRLEPDGVTYTAGAEHPDTTLRLPAEAWVRLIYGRLDPDHTPDTVSGHADVLEALRRVYPGP